MLLPDVSVLVHAVNGSSPQHGEASRWLRSAVDGGRGLGLSWVAVLGFLRLSTKPGIYAAPLPVPQALAIVNAWLSMPGAQVLQPGPRHAALLSGTHAASSVAKHLVCAAGLAMTKEAETATNSTAPMQLDETGQKLH